MEQVLVVMVEVSAISQADGSRLAGLVQTQSVGSDSDMDAPAAEVYRYESKSGGIVDALNALLEKAQGQLDAATNAGTSAKNRNDLLKQGWEDEIKYANKELKEVMDVLQHAIPILEKEMAGTQFGYEAEQALGACYALLAKIEDSSADVNEDEAEPKKATGIREKEVAALAAANREFKEVIDMLRHARSEDFEAWQFRRTEAAVRSLESPPPKRSRS